VEIASLGSGSRGNGTLIRNGTECILIDCGFHYKEALKRFAARKILPDDICAIFVTHEHSDHATGVKALSAHHAIPVYATRGTWLEMGGRSSAQHFELTDRITLETLTIEPVTVPHDARQPVQYVISTDAFRFGVLSDLGSISKTVRERYQDLDGLSLEFNHDLDMLQNGAYPSFLKQRVGGNYGHLNNWQATELLKEVASTRLKTVIACHLSAQNNAEPLVKAALDQALGKLPTRRFIATQDDGFDWMTLG